MYIELMPIQKVKIQVWEWMQLCTIVRKEAMHPGKWHQQLPEIITGQHLIMFTHSDAYSNSSRHSATFLSTAHTFIQLSRCETC